MTALDKDTKQPLAESSVDSLGYWFDGIIDLSKTARSRKKNKAGQEVVAFIVSRFLEQTKKILAQGPIARLPYVAFCGRWRGKGGAVPLDEEEEIADCIDATISQLFGSLTDSVAVGRHPLLTIQLLLGKDRSSLKASVASIQEGMDRVGGDDEKIEATVLSIKKALRKTVETIPTEYPRRRAYLLAVSDAVRQEIAAELEEPFNRHVADIPQRSYQEKKDLAKYVNAEIRKFGLALEIAATPEPCILRADGQVEGGRFQFDCTDGAGKRRYLNTSKALPRLKLIADDLGRAPGQRSERFR